MRDPAKPRLVFVHGIGGPREPRSERDSWLRALAAGVRSAGHSHLVSALIQDWAVESCFAYYGDVYRPGQAQGTTAGPVREDEADLVAGLLGEIIETQLARSGARDALRLTDLREQLDRFSGDGLQDGRQGIGEQVRRLSYLCTSILGVPGLRQAAQWTSGQQMLSHVSQVGRYLSRNPADGSGRGLDELIRDRIRSSLPPDRPAIVVSHSLGTIVALEALHEHPGPVPLFVTLGSPLATPAVVLPRLRPQPPRTPDGVGRWLDFWDNDDIVVPKRTLPHWMKPNAAGVRPHSMPVVSEGLWVHNATAYLRQPLVAGPIAEAVDRLSGAR